MGTPSDINRAHISFDSASKVLVAIDAGHDVDTDHSTKALHPTIEINTLVVLAFLNAWTAGCP